MDQLLRRNLLLLVVVVAIILCSRLSSTHAQSAAVSIRPFKYHVPILPINLLGPKKFERIIVPVDYSHEKKKPPSEKREKEPSGEKKVISSTVKPKINSKSYDDGKGNYYKSYSYVNRDDEHGKVPTDTAPNDIQPLHITTRDYEASEPETATESVHERKKKFKEQQERLKIENLPDTPYRVPETNWWHNSAKYNYGIIHDDFKGLDEIPSIGEVGSLEDAREVESKEVVAPAVIEPVPQVVPQVVHHEPSLHPVKFKSSFKDPSLQTQVYQRNDIPGKFLYKTQVYYPNYRDHLYLPVTTYYGHHQGLAKVFPVFSEHTVHHNSPPHSTSPSPPPVHYHPHHQQAVPPVAPRKVHYPPPQAIPPTQREQPSKPSEKPIPPPAAKEDAEEPDYDYEEEEDDGEGDEEGSSGKQEAESESGEEESEGSEEVGEDEDEETPKYRYASFRNSESDESGEDQFDKAWQKFGYGPKTAASDEEEDEYESSESRLVPERKKIVHMKMEYFSTPRKDSDEMVAEATNAVKASNDPKKDTEAIDESKVAKPKRRRKSKQGDKSQKQHPNAGPDDLKFFQDIYVEKKSPHEIEFGHVSETPEGWEERYERQNHSHDKNRHQGKIVWADKDGGYGQHYYDLNHGR